MRISNPRLPILFEFIVFISFVEVIFFLLLNNIGFQVFQLVPYLRIFVIFFTTLFILKRIKIPLSVFSISLKSAFENKVMVFWFFISIISFIVGILRFNPLLYLFTDFFYIVFGFFLFRLIHIKNNILKIYYKLNSKQEKYFIGIILFLTIIATFFKVVLPSFLVIFTMCYSLYLYKERKYKLALLYLIPFFLQILSANRALILVFVVLLFFGLSIHKISKRNIFVFFLFSIVVLLSLYLFLDDILKVITENMKESSTLRQRLVQLQAVFSGKINWNTPSALSLKQRVVEINLVIDFWLSNIFNFTFGGGLGATLDGSAFKDKGVVASAILGKGNIHNIHVLPFSILLRYGVFGLILVYFLLKLLLKYFKIILFEVKSYSLPLYLFIFCWIIYSIPAASFLWTTPLFWLILSINSDEN